MVTLSMNVPQCFKSIEAGYWWVSEEAPGQATGIWFLQYSGLRGPAVAKLTLESWGPQKAKSPMCWRSSTSVLSGHRGQEGASLSCCSHCCYCVAAVVVLSLSTPLLLPSLLPLLSLDLSQACAPGAAPMN